MTNRSLGNRAPFLWVLLPLMAGLVVGRQQWVPAPPLALAVAAVLSATLSLARPRNVPGLWAPALVLAMTLSGAALYELNRARLPAWDSLPVREVRVTLELDRVFPPHPHAKSVTGLAHLLATDAHLT